MKFLKILNNKKKLEEIYAPISGLAIDVTNVNDKVFSTKMMGESIAFRPQTDIVVAPCNGIISLIAKTKHALWLTSETDMEVMIHIGLNTVELEGEGFEALVIEKQKVRKGDPILKFDRDKFSDKNIDTTSIMAITNSNNYEIELENVDFKVETAKSIVMRCKKREE